MHDVHNVRFVRSARLSFMTQKIPLVDFRKSPTKEVRKAQVVTVTLHGEDSFVAMDAQCWARINEKLELSGLKLEELARTA